MRTGRRSSSGVPLHRDKPLAEAALRIHQGEPPPLPFQSKLPPAEFSGLKFLHAAEQASGTHSGQYPTHFW